MQFSSMPVHRQSGMNQYPFRFYDSTMQRWINQDPIGEIGGVNLYGFVWNCPLGYIDPWGFLWYDDLGNWIQNQAAISKDFLNNNLPPDLAAAADTAIDLGAGLASTRSEERRVGKEGRDRR